jgi:hypothetical protein
MLTKTRYTLGSFGREELEGDSSLSLRLIFGKLLSDMHRVDED